MTNYVLAFHGLPNRQPPSDFEEKWSSWFGGLGPSVVDWGNRVTSVRRIPEGTASGGGLTGYIVVEADDLDTASTYASACPGISYGISVEIAEVDAPRR